MAAVHYTTGEDIIAGDRIRYDGEAGHVEFLVTERTGDPGQDWFMDQFPRGGVMIWAEGFGSVFLELDQIDEELELVTRAASGA